MSGDFHATEKRGKKGKQKLSKNGKETGKKAPFTFYEVCSSVNTGDEEARRQGILHQSDF